MIRPPVLPNIPEQYEARAFLQLREQLRSYFERANTPSPVNVSTLNINLATLPTQAALATLAQGDVYRDTTAGNVLKVKI